MFRVLWQLDVLPYGWQDPATPLAELCHPIGKALLSVWQNTAKGMKGPVLFIERYYTPV